MSSLFFAVLLALIPISFWYAIVMRPHREGLQFFFFLVFIMAFGFAYAFKNFAEPFLHVQLPSFIGLFGTLVVIGICIEYGKNTIVRFVGHQYFHRIDDVIDLSFATALGFAFYENIFIFLPFFTQGFSFEAPIALIKEVIMQIFYVLPVHMTASGIFGFYYGMSHFALPELQKPFYYMLKGGIISALVYGSFFYVYSIDLKTNDILEPLGYGPYSYNESFFPIFGFIFGSVSIMYLFSLIESQYEIAETREDQEKRAKKTTA